MVEPTGYTALDLIGFTDKGTYSASATYVKNDLVHVGNSTWRCLIDDTTGITPTEGTNWTIFIESATSLSGMSDVELNTPKDGDGLVHDGNNWTNVPIMTKEQWKKNGAYNLYNHNLQTQVVSTGGGSVTVTVNRTVGSPDYGTFSIVGTVGSATDIVVGALDSNVFKAGQKYKLTGCPSGGGSSTYNIRVTGAGVEDHGDGVEFTATGSDQMKIQLRGASINATFKPMIITDLNATYADYQPYAKTNRELTEETSIKFYDLSSAKGTNITFLSASAVKLGDMVFLQGHWTGSNNSSEPILTVPQELNPKATKVYGYGMAKFSTGYVAGEYSLKNTAGNLYQSISSSAGTEGEFSVIYSISKSTT